MAKKSISKSKVIPGGGDLLDDEDEDAVEPEEKEDKEDKGETVSLEDVDNEVEDTDDGGAIVRLKDKKDEKKNQKHFANIIDDVDQGVLNAAITDLLEKIEKDKESRKKRDEQYREGLRRTGLGDDAPGGAEFSGANKVVHPLLVEACVDFSARFMKEVFPPGGPVKSKLIGDQDKVKLKKAARKSDYMNWQSTEQMPEFRGELEQLSTQLPLGGGQYLKLLWNGLYRRPMAEFVSIDDIYLPFSATNFYTAERRTHAQKITQFEYRRRVKSGMYMDVDLGLADQVEFSKSSKANDKIEGREDNGYDEDGLRTVFEIYTHLEFDNGPEPYILSIDKASGKGLSLYRNWEPNDARQVELDWIVEFPFVPWRGAYPIGLTHMIGGLSAAATGALRALLDSAHIQNSATMLKLKGGPSGQTIDVQPTKVVEIEGGALIDDVRKLAMPLPFNGPSPTLFQLLGFLVEAGKGVIQTSFEKLADQSPNQPVGTTMALIEQGMVVFSSIHSRLHGSMARCFKILHRINSAYLTQEDIDTYAGSLDIMPSDFDGPMDVIPVSDPSIFSETQRFAQAQAIMQRAQAMPQLYDVRKVEEMFLRNMKVPANDVLQAAPGSEDMDPVSENVAAAMSRPIYVLPSQDHRAHMMTHMAFLKSQLFGSNPAIVKTFLYPMVTHLRDHLLNYYLVEAHEAVNKAQKAELIEDEGSAQAQIIVQVQQFIEQQMGTFAQELAQLDQQAQQFKPQPPPPPPDSSMQIAQIAAQTQSAIAQQKMQVDQAKLQATQQIASEKLQATQQAAQTKAELAKQEEFSRQQIEGMKQDAEDQRVQAELAARERMNTADNDTAKLLAAAEISSGERVAVSTGTGINPSP